MRILPQFSGIAVHDAYSSYFGYGCQHSLCNAHHLRELSAVDGSDVETQGWACQMRSLLSHIKQTVDEAKASGNDRLGPDQLDYFEARFDELLTEGERANPPPEKPHPKPKRGRVKKTKAQNLLGRLRRYRTETLSFMHNFGVPFDNNLAERDIRMLKVQQKISGCFRSEQGASAFCRIRSYISTVRKHRSDVLQALQGVFTGHSFSPTPEALQLAP
jgi:transposase